MGLDLDGIFGGVADTLINNTFDTPIVYVHSKGMSYDPTTGDVTEDIEQFNLKAGIEQIGINELGGTGETRDIKLYIKHGTNGLPYECTTGDRIEYRGRIWKVTVIEPEFTAKDAIASYITARAD